MKFEIRRPCSHCPFRNDVPGYLMRARAEQIADSVRDPNGTVFPCHETAARTDSPKEKWQACAGSLLVVERDQGPNQMHRIAERLGLYAPEKLDRKAPCFNSLSEFVRHHTNAMMPKKKKSPRGPRRR